MAKKKVAKKPPKKTERQQWKEKYVALLKEHHSRNIDKMATRLLNKVDNARRSMVTRSKKYDVDCSITINELRELVLEYYGQPDRYLPERIVKMDTMVFDHRIPVTKSGPSTKDNIQIITKFSNSLKGSLDEEQFFIFLEWLKTIPEELKKDITIRLAGGIR